MSAVAIAPSFSGDAELLGPMTPAQAALVDEVMRLVNDAARDPDAFAGAATDEEVQQLRRDGFAFVSGVRVAVDLLRKFGCSLATALPVISPPSRVSSGIWHRDGQPLVYVVVALTEVNRANGATEVVPGSQRGRLSAGGAGGVRLDLPFGGTAVFNSQALHRRGFDKHMTRWVMFISCLPAQQCRHA